MRLTPLDIRKQEFTRTFRGYEAEEVQAFLHMVSSQWEGMLDEQRHLEDRLRELESKLVHYEKVEEALQEALQTARETSRKALENAEQKARLIIMEAEKRAEDIKKDAETERHQIKREAAKLSGRRNEIVARLRAFLMSEMELLARFEGDDPIGFIKLLPTDERRLQRMAEHALPPVRLDDDDDDFPASETEQPDAYASDEAEADLPEAAPAAAAPPRREAAPETEEPRRSPRVTWHGQIEEEDEEDEPSEFAPQDEASDFEEEAADEAAERPPVREEIKHGPGWTARTVISPPSRPATGRPTEEARTAGSDEEIEKIRRILNDLD